MKIMIADDHPIFRSGVRNLLQTTEDLIVVGEAASGDEVLRLVEQCQPDLILMDIRMPGLNGIEATRLVKEKYPHIHVLILTMFRDDQSVFTAMRVGAKGYVLKDADEIELLQSVRIVGNGGAVFSSDIAARMMHFFSEPRTLNPSEHPALSELSKREMEILERIAEGHTNAQIGARLNISAKTVANYVSMILNKLQVEDRNEASRILQDFREG
ncbi:Transcriptional regulatory protein DegU [Paenibacillus allorhizoplanae]|uniref:Transcriptional regulatory protein DegU n=1 Tax=Paenibacillus allorhizoplanae TaxID=2905648 RepID=A0ABN8H5W1_9BACL|nr:MULTISPECIES: response regulator transcription factor [Paenibacillus]KRE67845.1 LuxR family transcriptional regulator [Paenibacillus sp. Soil750]CAH1231379.1 Transcriptional regulatory protein DegU [Paenibacillus allorhizoplanae]